MLWNWNTIAAITTNENRHREKRSTIERSYLNQECASFYYSLNDPNRNLRGPGALDTRVPMTARIPGPKNRLYCSG